MISRRGSFFAWWTLGLICLVAFVFMVRASWSDAAIMDELAHIPSGYGYVHNLDYRLNPEHPPLVKALAMFPVLFLNPQFPTQSDAWKNQVNAQWEMGTKFLYESGNDATEIVRMARFGPIFLTLLLIVLIYLFARGLMGPWWALLPSALFGLSPTALAHGHYVTTDIGAACGILFSTFMFVRYMENPTRRRLWHAGFAFGIAQVMKFSAPLLVPLFIFLILARWLRSVILDWQTTAGRITYFSKTLGGYLWRLALIFAIGYVCVVYPLYFLFTAHYPIEKQTSDTAFILGSFADGPTPAGQFCKGLRCLADADIWMTKNPVLRPFAEYALGVLMVIQRSDGGNTIYYRGEVAGTGGWTYFPLLFLLKEPIPTLVIVLLGLALGTWWSLRGDPHGVRGRVRRLLDYIGINFGEFAMISFIVLYWGYSMRSPLNIGFRHLMPTIPFIYILAAGVWKKWISRISFPHGVPLPQAITVALHTFLGSAIKYLLLIILLLWLTAETAVAAPYFLSYFNEFAGGTPNGYHFVTDSNYDWGQDLLRLKAWMDSHPEVDRIAIDYFGGGNIKYYFKDRGEGWSSSRGNPAQAGIHWLAVSVNTLQGDIQPLAAGQHRNPDDEYTWLTAMRPPAPGMGNVPPPDFRIGTSIFVYHLPGVGTENAPKGNAPAY